VVKGPRPKLPDAIFDKLNPVVQKKLKKLNAFEYLDEESTREGVTFEEEPQTNEVGDCYQGEWKVKGRNVRLREGKGVQVFKDGSLHEGFWKRDMIQGRGRAIFEDGSVYTGQWKGAKRNGSGIYQAADGTRYDGEWLRDTEHGTGK